MIPFELAVPRSLGEAIRLLDRDDPAIRPIAGGTALMLMMKTGLFRPIRLVSLHAIEGRRRDLDDSGLRGLFDWRIVDPHHGAALHRRVQA